MTRVEGLPPAGVVIDSSTVAERYRASIYRYVLRVHERLPDLKDPAALEAWLYRIATNLCYDRFRRREHRRPPLPLVSLGSEEGTALPDPMSTRTSSRSTTCRKPSATAWPMK